MPSLENLMQSQQDEGLQSAPRNSPQSDAKNEASITGSDSTSPESTIVAEAGKRLSDDAAVV